MATVAKLAARGRPPQLFSFLALALLAGLTACAGPGCNRERDAISQAIRAQIAGAAPATRPSRELHEALDALYPAGAPPLWTGSGDAREQGRRAVALLLGAEAHGLRPEHYDAPGLQQRLDSPEAGRAGSDELASLDIALSTQMLRFLRAIHRGRVNPERVGFDYHKSVDAEDLARPLRQAATDGRLEELVAQLEPTYLQYRRLKAALAEHRRLVPAGTAPPVAVRRIELALERLRWLPHAPKGRFLVVNIPAFRLVAFRSPADDQPALQMAVVVGKATETETPLFSEDLRFVIFRPSWYPPPSIVQNEIVPALEEDSRYLERQRMELVPVDAGDDSPALPPTSENLALLEEGQLALRQEPGPGSALGLVKFDFPNEHRVYIHGTPSTGLFARARRDFSHGCIRAEDPAALAEFVLAEQPGWSRARIEAAMNAERTQRVDVEPALPVMIFYTTAFVRPDGKVELFDDIYGLDADLERELEAAQAGALGPARTRRVGL